MGEYEERYVAFIDILVFKDLVNKSEIDPTILNKLISVLSDLKNYDNHIKKFEQIDSSYDGMCRMSTFSDSVLISARADGFGLISIVVIIGMICSNLFLQGIYVRGGISKGMLIHTDNMVLGNGLINAYELESKTAVFPRVIIDKSFMDDCRARINIPEFMDYFRLDFDGLSHLHVFHPFFMDFAMQMNAKQNEDKSSVLEAAIKHIERAMDSTNLLGVKSKIFWLARYFNESVNPLGARVIEL